LTTAAVAYAAPEQPAAQPPVLCGTGLWSLPLPRAYVSEPHVAEPVAAPRRKQSLPSRPLTVSRRPPVQPIVMRKSPAEAAAERESMLQARAWRW